MKTIEIFDYQLLLKKYKKIFSDKKYQVKINSDEMGFYPDYENNENVLNIAFNGTDDWKEMVSNLMAPRIFPDNLMPEYHRGALNAFKTIICVLDDILRTVRVQRADIVGFSRGGWFAMLTAVYFADKRIPSRLLTIGSPRIGNKAACERIEKNNLISMVKIIHHGDIVHKLPPERRGYRDINCMAIYKGRETDKYKFWNFIKYHKGLI